MYVFICMCMQFYKVIIFVPTGNKQETKLEKSWCTTLSQMYNIIRKCKFIIIVVPYVTICVDTSKVRRVVP